MARPASHQSVQDALSSIDLFAGLSKSELKRVQSLMTPVTIKAGREFITQGTPGREAYILLSGEAKVRRNGRLVVTLGAGEVLGEIALLGGLPRSASVTAETEVEAAVLTRREFIALLDESPVLSRKIAIAVIARLQQLEPGLLN